MPVPPGQTVIVVRDDRRRRRPTVAFRWLLAIPHFVWLGAWGSGMALLLPVAWIVVLVKRRLPDGLHEVYAMFVRYALHVSAYALLAAEPFPGFLGRPGTYPVDVIMPAPQDQSRWSTAFRGVLALPPLALSFALGSGMITSLGTAWTFSAGVAWVVAFLAWFACLATGRMPPGFRDAVVYALGYGAQTAAYLFLLTPRYPDSRPDAVPLLPRPRHPVRMTDTHDLRRHRLLVGFRAVLAAPHFVWLTLWSLAVLVVAVVAWLPAIVLGRLPRFVHRFVARYVRYQAHVAAFATLAAGPFPGFTGRPGSYPLDIELDGPERQPRPGIAFRWLLAIPALVVVSALSSAQSVAAVGAWFAALFTGRAPAGLQRLLAYTIRYTAETYAYALLLTARYPHSGPGERPARAWVEAPEAPPGDTLELVAA